MFEVGADGSSLDRVFRVGDRPLYILVFYLAFVAILPLSSLYELATTGTIDMDAVGKGRQKLPVWSLYLGGWLVFLPTLWTYLPVLRYFSDTEMLRLGPQGITIHGVTLAPEEVLGFRFSFMRGHLLQSVRGDFPIHPWMIKGGVEALADAFPHVPPLKRAELPSWALGD